MSDVLLVGKGHDILDTSAEEWKQSLLNEAHHINAHLKFMSPKHHNVRNFVVRELPSIGKPITPEKISVELQISVDRVSTILDDLEKNLTFLFRNEAGEVVWAYPVTVEKTPHYLTFSTGENIYAA